MKGQKTHSDRVCFRLIPFEDSFAFGHICCFVRLKQSMLDVEFQWFLPEKETFKLGHSHLARGSFLKDLWKTTCFEVFLGGKNKKKYCEWNFSLTGQYGFFLFDAYRQETLIEPPPKPSNQRVYLNSSQIILKASFDLESCFIPNLTSENLDLSLTAVIENVGGEIQYFAVKHAGSRPDFHLRSSFFSII